MSVNTYFPDTSGWQMGGGGFLGKLFSSGFWGGPGGMAAMTFGLPMLSRLLGGGSAQEKAYDEWKKKWNYTTGPQFMADRMNAYTPLMNQMMAGQHGGIMTNANAFQNNLSRNLAASGANRGGIGVLAATAASSMAANQLGDLATEGRRGTMQLAMNDRDNMMKMLSQGPMGQDNRYLGGLGEGADAFMEYLMERERQKRPVAGGGYYAG